MVEGGANSWPRETRGRITWRDVEPKKKKKKKKRKVERNAYFT